MMQRIWQLLFLLNLALAILAGGYVWLHYASVLWVALAAIAGFSVLHIVAVKLEFIISMIANRGLAEMGFFGIARAYFGELFTSAKVFAWDMPWATQSKKDCLENAQGKQGVLLVHGYLCNRGFWNHEMDRLRAQGVPHMAITLEPAFGSINSYASLVHEAVEKLYAATGKAPLLVCHSMGGLAARAYIAAHGHERIARIITLGTPHHGTLQAHTGLGRNAAQMHRMSEWLTQNAAATSEAVRTKFTCFYSNGDNIVAPFKTAMLESADNRFVSCTGHVALAFCSAYREYLNECLKLNKT